MASFSFRERKEQSYPPPEDRQQSLESANASLLNTTDINVKQQHQQIQ